MLRLPRLDNNRLATLIGILEATLLWQQAVFPNAIPRDLALLLGGGAVAAHGTVTNKKDKCPDPEPLIIPIAQEPPLAPPPDPDRFTVAMAFTAKWEGGEVNHPSDPGGHTNLGVTQATYNTYRALKKLAPRSVKHLNKKEAEAVYRRLFWIREYDLCCLPLAVAMFDTGVNFRGPNDSIRFMQQALGVGVDGAWGPMTQAAFEKANTPETALKIVEGRIAYRHQRVKQHPPSHAFLTGWLNRDNDLADTVRRL